MFLSDLYKTLDGFFGLVLLVHVMPPDTTEQYNTPDMQQLLKV